MVIVGIVFIYFNGEVHNDWVFTMENYE